MGVTGVVTGVDAAATVGVGVAGAAVTAVGVATVVPAAVVVDGGRSYFCSCNKYASAVGTAPQDTSRVFVLALTS